MKMKFLGKPTLSFSYLQTGEVYNIEAVPSSIYNIMIIIHTKLQGKKFKDYCAYDTFESFFDNWEVVGEK